jgi:membrane-associated phospholipid phosphatase
MTTRDLFTYRLTIFLSLITISIIAVDRPLAIFIDTHLAALQPTFRKILSAIEFFGEYSVFRFFVMGLVLIAAIWLLIKDKGIQRAKIFFFLGATLASSRLVTILLKIFFERNRPFVFINDRSVRDFFSAGADSFPSGHSTNYFAFFLPLIVLMPRYKVPLLIMPAFIALQRVMVNEHYLSDVLAGALVASLMTLLFQRIFKIQGPSLFLPPNKNI